MFKHIFASLLIFAALLSMITISGCDNQGPAEKVGEKIDQSMESVKDTAEEVGDRITGEGTAEGVGEKIDETVESVKKSVDANN